MQPHAFVFSLMFCTGKDAERKVDLQNSFLVMLLKDLEEGSLQFFQYQAGKCSQMHAHVSIS